MTTNQVTPKQAREAWMHMTMAYGAPSAPYEPPVPFVPLVPPSPSEQDWSRLLVPGAKRKLRITTRCEENGELKLKVYVDGELAYEAVSEGAGTLTVETSV